MAKDGFGTLLKKGDGATPTEAFTTVAKVTGLTPFAYSREALDATTMEQADSFKQFIGGKLVDAGELSANLDYEPDVHNVLLDLLDDEAPTNFQVVFSTGDTCKLALVMTGFKPGEVGTGGKLTATASFKVSGKPVWS